MGGKERRQLDFAVRAEISAASVCDIQSCRKRDRIKNSDQ